MSFEISEKVDAPNIFLAKFSELSGQRFDPGIVLFTRKVHRFNYPVHKFQKYFRESPQYGAGERGIPRESNEQTRYVRITDIDENGILSNELGATAENLEDRYLLEDGDLLLARSGNTVGKAYLHRSAKTPYACIFAGYLIRVRLASEEMRPEYAFALTQLPYYKEWVKAVQRVAGQPNINADEYSDLEIPVPPLEIQQQIVDLLQTAHHEKQQRETEARKMLDSIDAVLLAELGITPQPEPPNEIENRIFITKFSETTGQRWDSIYHQSDIFHFIRKSKYELCKLNELASYFLTGFAAGRGDQAEEENGIIQIRPTNLSEERELVFHRNVYIHKDELEKRPSDVLKRGEVLFNNTNSQEQVGKTVLFDLPGEYFSSNHITRIATDKERLHPQFLCYLLNLYQRRQAFFKLCTNWNNQSGVGSDILARLPIPLPNIETQTEIVTKLNDICEQANNLREEAAAQLETAKREIEAMILGETTNS